MIRIIRLYFLVFIAFYVTSVAASSTITITNGDTANYGFNDPTPIVPAGGNNASTLGQARLNAVQYTANKLSILLNSTVEINIIVSFLKNGGDSGSATLAAAYAPSYRQNFNGALLPDTLYHVAIAEKLSGIDMNGDRTGDAGYEVSIGINSDVDGGVALGAIKWYYGFDAKPVFRGVNILGDSVFDIDFVTVLMHEIVHGLGFSTPMVSASGIRKSLLNDTYIENLEHHGTIPANYSNMSLDSQRAVGNRAGTNLHWIGSALVAAANNNLGFRTVGHAGMYAPDPVEGGSSVSHFSTSFSSPDEMMEPAYQYANHNIGFAAQILEDVGWGKLNSNPASTELGITVTNPNKIPTQGTQEIYSVTVVNNSAQTATGISVSHFLPANSDFVSVIAANAATCSTSNVRFNRILSCYLPSLPASGTAIFNVTVAINKTGINDFAANVESLNTDTNWLNNNAINGVTPDTPPIPGAPVFNIIRDQSVEVGQTVILNLAATDKDGPIPTITIQNQPRGSQFFANQDGSARFSWTPTSQDIGQRVLNFTATDGNPASSLESNISVSLVVTVASTRPTRNNNDVPNGGCTLNKTAKFDPVIPLLLLLSLLFLFRHKVIG